MYHHRRVLRSISFSRGVSHVEHAIKLVSLATRINPGRPFAVFRVAKASFADADLSAQAKKKDRRGTSRSVLIELYTRADANSHVWTICALNTTKGARGSEIWPSLSLASSPASVARRTKSNQCSNPSVALGVHL